MRGSIRKTKEKNFPIIFEIMDRVGGRAGEGREEEMVIERKREGKMGGGIEKEGGGIERGGEGGSEEGGRSGGTGVQDMYLYRVGVEGYQGRQSYQNRRH